MVAVFACLTPLMMAAPIHGSAGRECHSESEKYPSESSQAVEEIGVTERCTRRVSVEAPIGTITPVASVTDEHARLIAVCFTASQYAHHNGHGGPLLI